MIYDNPWVWLGQVDVELIAAGKRGSQRAGAVVRGRRLVCLVGAGEDFCGGAGPAPGVLSWCW